MDIHEIHKVVSNAALIVSILNTIASNCHDDHSLWDQLIQWDAEYLGQDAELVRRYTS